LLDRAVRAGTGDRRPAGSQNRWRTKTMTMMTRRDLLQSGALVAGSVALMRGAQAAEPEGARDASQAAKDASGPPPGASKSPFTPVVTPSGSALPWKMKNGAKEFHLIAEPVKREFAPGMIINCWGYNGQTPGPTIEAVEGDRVRLLVTNKLPEPTSVHW